MRGEKTRTGVEWANPSWSGEIDSIGCSFK